MSKLSSFDSATMIGLLTSAGVYAIYHQSMPNITDLRAHAPHDGDAEGARKGAAVKSAALLGAVFFIARDLNSYIISGVGLVGIDYLYKHGNAVHPHTGKLDVDNSAETVAPGLEQAYPLADYSDDSNAA